MDQLSSSVTPQLQQLQDFHKEELVGCIHMTAPTRHIDSSSKWLYVRGQYRLIVRQNFKQLAAVHVCMYTVNLVPDSLTIKHLEPLRK